MRYSDNVTTKNMEFTMRSQAIRRTTDDGRRTTDGVVYLIQ